MPDLDPAVGMHDNCRRQPQYGAIHVTALEGWENFYVIVGSSAGGLTGLTFVVIALAGDANRIRPAAIGAFVTPTIVHFGTVLALAAFLTMPHQGVLSLSVGLAVAGLAGLAYVSFIASSIRTTPEYAPVLEDWIWNVILPTVAYVGFVVVAAVLWKRPAQALYLVATLALVLLYIGIHNAWDIAVWMTLHKKDPPDSPPANPG